MKRTILFLLGAVLVGLSHAIHSQPASADAAPPLPASGSNLYPSIGNTKVRMVSEYVLMDIAGNSDHPWGEAQVTAEFLMQNMGETTEEMRARFPLNLAEYRIEEELESGKEFCDFIGAPAIEDIDVWVNEQKAEVEITTKTVVDALASNSEVGEVYITLPCWAHFDVVFPPGQDVNIKVTYEVPGYDPRSRFGYSGTTEFTYVLGTGAGWFDTIGNANIVARLPYDVTDLNFWNCNPENCLISGKEIYWHYEDFEPQGNINIEIMKPAFWLKILLEKENVQNNVNDGEAWGRLAKAYKDSIEAAGKGGFLDYDSPGSELYILSKEAYQKTTELLPNDADWHYGFADLLCEHAEWNESTREDWVACAEQLKFALDINPTHEAANELLQGLNFIQDSEYFYSLDEKLVDLSGPEPIYLILTSQPTATSTPVPTNTPLALIPENTATSTTPPTATQVPTLTNLPPTLFPTDPPASPTAPASQDTDSSSPTIYILFGTVILLVFVLLAINRKK